MRLQLAPLLAALILTGCATTGVAPQSAILNVQPGMKRAEVVSLLGEPGNRSFRGNGEALQYCRKPPGLIVADSEEYATVWLVNGSVVGLTTQRKRLDFVACQAFPSVDWGQVPPDVRVRIEQ